MGLCDFVTESGEMIVTPNMIERYSPKYANLAAKLAKSLASKSLTKIYMRSLSRFVNGNAFKLLSIIVILLNFALMVAQTDWRMQHIYEEEPVRFFHLSLVFSYIILLRSG